MFDIGDLIEISLFHSSRPLLATIQQANNKLLVLALDHSTESNLLREGTRLCLRYAAEDGLYVMETTVLKCSDRLFVVPKERLGFQQRRRSERLACNFLGRYKPHTSLEEMQRAAPEEGEVTYITDISQGGCLIRTKQILLAGTALGLRIELNDGEPLFAEASVVRCTLAKDKDSRKGAYEVGLKFTRMLRVHQLCLMRLLHELAQAA
ncbi:flagellar brake protein [Chthonomonas calidirosea]|uniref:flagellar brake protein n=1 Tax=Chthonomonas calidirosea TaxID=454171 RepID=UPI0006EC6B11|nr:PilZ domain-containing protein [Chthonomonas calidirosea]CEK17747.1 predicted glycosyltransferase [Chthonomonas calidirosea]